MSNLTDKRVPVSMANHVGIEFEFFTSTPRANMVALLKEMGLAKYCSLGTDGSIEPDETEDNYDLIDKLEALGRDMSRFVSDIVVDLEDGETPDTDDYKQLLKRTVALEAELKKVEAANVQSGYELRVCLPEAELQSKLVLLHAFFKQTKSKVNDSCGLHVHIDMRQRNLVQSFNRLRDNQAMLYDKCSYARRDNAYCRPISDRSNHYDTGHYNGINAGDAYDKHKTIEVRIKEGTTDCKDVYDWIKLLLATVDGVQKKKAVKPSVKPKRRKTS